MDVHYAKAFHSCVENRWNRLSPDMQRNASAKSSNRRGQLSLREGEADALADVFYYQEMHMPTFIRLLESSNNQGLIDIDDLMHTQNITVVDFGAGAATAGIAINTHWGNYLSSFDYFPIEPHPGMQSIGSCLLNYLSTSHSPSVCSDCNLHIPQHHVSPQTRLLAKDDVLHNWPLPENLPTHKTDFLLREQPRSGISWRDKEINYLKLLHKEGVTIEVIAELLERTSGAIRNRLIREGLTSDPCVQHCPECDAVLPQAVGWQWPVHDYMKNLRELQNTHLKTLINTDRLFFTFSYIFQQNALRKEEVQRIVELISLIKMERSDDKKIEILATGAKTRQLYNHMDQYLLPKFDDRQIMYDMTELSLSHSKAWKRYVRIGCD